MIIYNGLGGAMMICAVIAGFLFVTVRGADDFGALDAAAMAVVAGALDLAWRTTRGKAALAERAEAESARLPRRVRSRPGKGTPWMHPSAGGHVFWLPVWIVSAGVLALTLLASR